MVAVQHLHDRLATEMPRCFSISIQSLVAWRDALRALTEPAIWIAPENSSSFSVSVVLPASGWEMMAKVRRRRVSEAKDTGSSGDWGQAERSGWKSASIIWGFRGALQPGRLTHPAQGQAQTTW
jgi:hypothetical protein